MYQVVGRNKNWSSDPSQILGTSDASRHAGVDYPLNERHERDSSCAKICVKHDRKIESAFTSIELVQVGESNVPNFQLTAEGPSLHMETSIAQLQSRSNLLSGCNIES